MQRRRLIQGMALAASAGPLSAMAQGLLTLGKPQAFDYAWLKGQARELSQTPYQAPSTALPAAISDLDYDHYQSIRFKSERSLWADQDQRFRVQFYHPGFLFKERVRVFEVIAGQAQELAYQPDMFDLSRAGIKPSGLPKDLVSCQGSNAACSLALKPDGVVASRRHSPSYDSSSRLASGLDGGAIKRHLSPDTTLGFAGLRIQHHLDWGHDIASFLGASYFRSVGAERQYGLSARGLAIDFGADKGEEFPRFTTFWLERPAPQAAGMTVYALLDSPSVTGAYRIDIQPGGSVSMDIDGALYPRKVIDRLGIAPLTSMFFYGENDRRKAGDWRPEIHDSDGLSMLNGTGEWLWRPLSNPAGVRLYSYVDSAPQGFGLIQRDRKFDHYQDDGAFYERRPSVWVTPKKAPAPGWGPGSVQLLELPAPNETFDNIVAAWVPETLPQPGQELLFSYRLTWGAKPPMEPHLAQVVATHTGIGGVVAHKRPYFSWRFVVDFQGGSLPLVLQRARVDSTLKMDAMVSASRGLVELVSARPQFEINGYRATFDLRTTDASTEPIDLRLFLCLQGEPLSETWIYQWVPPSIAEQRSWVE